MGGLWVSMAPPFPKMLASTTKPSGNAFGTRSALLLFRKISKGAEKVLIVTDDNTRHTPLDRLLPS